MKRTFLPQPQPAIYYSYYIVSGVVITVNSYKPCQSGTLYRVMRDDLTFSEQVIPYEQLLGYCYGYGAKAVSLEGRTVDQLYPGERVFYVRKTHQGWKEAQIILIQKILELENEQVLLRKDVKGKVERLPKDQRYVYDVLERHKRRLKDFADGIVWQMYGLDKSRVRAGVVEEESHGFLIDKNLESGLSYINQVNKDADSFAILSDITTVLGVGDVLQAAKGAIRLVELKEGSKNGELVQILKEKNNSIDEAREVVLKKYSTDPLTLKQFDRISRQIKRADQTAQYEAEKTSRHDHVLNEKVQVTEFDHTDQSYLEEVEGLCKEAVKDMEIKTAVIDDCLFVAVLPGSYDLDSMFIIKHALYHRFFDNDCHATESGEPQHSEFEAISKIRLERLDIGFAVSGMTPLTLLLSQMEAEAAVAILAGDLKVYTYLHMPSFIKLAEEMGLTVTRTRSRNNTMLDKGTFSWENKDIVFNGIARLVNTNYMEMCCGFDTPRDMLEKIRLSIDGVKELVAEHAAPSLQTEREA